jgi:uroporphyrinogen-III synthase
MSPSLAGRRIVVTRSADDSAEWAERLAEAGAVPIVYPCIRTETIETPTLGAELAAAAADADWLVFTSRRGVETFAALCPRRNDLAARVAVVGAATAEAARTALGRVDLVGAGTAAALGAELAATLAGTAAQCVIAVAENAGGTLAEALSAAGARCRRFDLYRTVPAPPRAPKELLSAIAADVVVFASPSAVAGFMNQVAIDTGLKAVAIGPATSRTLGSAGVAVAAEARRPDLDAIIDAIIDAGLQAPLAGNQEPLNA